MKKRILAVLLALCMTLALLPGMALAAEGDDATPPAGQDPVRFGTEVIPDYSQTPSSLTYNIFDRTLIRCYLTLADGVVADGIKMTFAADASPRFESNEITHMAGFTIGLNGAALASVVPARIVVPVPAGIDWDDLVLLHYDADRDLWVDAEPVVENRNNRTVSFEVNEFGRFIIAQRASTDYITIVKSDNGEVIPSVRRADAGDRVNLYIHPNKGYELDTLTVKDARGRSITCRALGDDAYSFTMPEVRVTVEAVFKAIEDTTAATPGAAEDEPFTGLGTPGISGIVLNPAAMPYTDVKSNDWFYNNVEYMWKHYLMSGVSDSQFAPNTTTNRGMIWTILARMNNVRTDINPGSTWYERGMLWCLEQGVTDGSNPLGDITREQLATMLWRNAGKPVGNGDLSKFSDSASVSEYAVTAVRWAVGNGILNGSNGLLDPQGTATRAQVAAMVARYGDKVVR